MTVATNNGDSQLLVPDGVGATSLAAAAMRDVETKRPDRLFDDPFAGMLASAATPGGQASGTLGLVLQMGSAGNPLWASMTAQIALRTRFFDDGILTAAAGGCRQFVLLGAGMDTRAFRLALPKDTWLFEVDLPLVLAFKETVMTRAGVAAGCHRRAVPADLCGQWVPNLLAAGFRPDWPTAWLAEGLLYTLPAVAVDRMLEDLTLVSPLGSRLAFEHYQESPALRAARRAADPEVDQLWPGGPNGELGPWLAEHGWNPTVRDLSEVAAAYHRPTPPGFDPAVPGSGACWIATGQRRS